MEKMQLVMALLDTAARVAKTPAFGPAQRIMEAAKLQAISLSLRSDGAAQSQDRQALPFDELPSNLSPKSKAEAAARAIIQYVGG